MNYFKKCKSPFKFNMRNMEDEQSFLFEMALNRGKKNGWYPEDWELADYEQHLFRRNLIPETEGI